MKKIILIGLLLATGNFFATGNLLAIGNALAGDLTEATEQLCGKIKVCGLRQLKQQGIPPEMQEMMTGMFDGMCASMVAPYATKAADAGLQKKAVACLDTINAMNCDQIMEGQADKSAECKEFEAAAEEAYPEES